MSRRLVRRLRRWVMGDSDTRSQPGPENPLFGKSLAPHGVAIGGAALALALALALTLLGAAPATADPDGDEGVIPGVAPETAPLSVISRETALFRIVFEGGGGADTDRIDRAMRAASPLQADVLTWSRLVLQEEGDWPQMRDFLQRRPGWPREDLLRARAEQDMPEGLSRDELQAFFAGRAPITARGARLYGAALIAAGRTDEGERLIVEAWRRAAMTPAEEKLFLGNHKTLLSSHHGARLEALLWRDRLSAAQRTARLVGAEARAWAEAWIALVRRRGNVDRMLSRLSAERLNHPGLSLARVRWRRGKKRFADAEALLLQASSAAAIGEAAAWADQRLYFSREAYEDGRFDIAYRLAGPHGLERGYDYARLEWFAGWIALRRLDDAPSALTRFERMHASVSRPISRGRAAYWAGEAAAAAGDAAKAKRWREKAAEHPNTFYGQLAAKALGRPLETTIRPVPIAAKTALPAGEQALVDAADLLYAAGEIRAARLFLKLVAENHADKEPILRHLAGVARARGDAGGEIAVADIGQEPNKKLWPELYPNPTAPVFTGRRTEAPLLLAIARQESRFTPDALSSAGARGLMQMMPQTARVTARRARLRYDQRGLSNNPDYNLTLADAHIQDLLRDYKGSYLLVAAAYNAGGGNVNRWLRRFGDPRDPDVDAVDWIESIPFAETRNYVQRVLEAVQVYRARLAEAPTPIQSPDNLTP